MTILRRLTVLASCWALLGCVGTTGGELLEVQAYAAGPRSAAPGASFGNSLGYAVTLTEARLFVGGVYLNRSRPTSVSSDTSCSLAGTYVAEVLGGREVDLLSAEPQPFPQRGFTTTDQALTGEVWLSRGDVNGTSGNDFILRVAGTAERGGKRYPFRGKLSIGQNRVIEPSDAALPGQHPLCKQRVVSPIPVALVAQPGDALLLRIDPRGMFGNVDFDTLQAVGGEYEFADRAGADQASDNLYAGLRRSTGVYELSWTKDLNR